MDSTQDAVRVDSLPKDSHGEVTEVTEPLHPADDETNDLGRTLSHDPQQTPQPLFQHHITHDTTPSLSSDSSESSPTTTISTFDSAPTAEQSPSSSPESPISYLPLPPFHQTMDSQKSRPLPLARESSPIDLLSPTRSESPSSKERNVKNLSLNVDLTLPRPSSAGSSETTHAFSAPTSPLKGPPKSARRKPNNLTIQTPGFERTSFPSREIPPTPSFRPALKQHESSPLLPSLTSPRALPFGGMQLPSLSVNRLSPFSGSDPNLSHPVQSAGLSEVKEDAGDATAPKSQEAQERGYPDGPVQIYDCGVYLFLEPSREEASKFDTVINVAKEVACPFKAPSPDTRNSVMAVWRNSSNPASVEPLTAMSEKSFKSAFEWPAPTETSPSTPKAVQREPEYLHVAWDHNSEILEDLYPLCQIIDARVASGKTVLIHCQLGVSRSASLIIAYGLYKGFKTDFHSMYTSVKERSQWVGPNMSLIYQLMDFRTKVANGSFARSSKAAPSSWFLNAHQESEMTPRPSPTVVKTPQIPLPVTKAPPSLEKPLPPIPLFGDSPISTRKPSLPSVFSNIALSSPRKSPELDSPSSVVSVATFQTAPPIPPKSAKRGAPRPLPLRERMFSSGPYDIPPHSPRKAPGSLVMPGPVDYPSLKMDLSSQEEPKTPSLFSPRTTEFQAFSFSQNTAGDLGSTHASNANSNQPPSANSVRMSVFSPAVPATSIDPRSPHHGDETGEILRHIDDVL